jgi:hypothetical protein
MLDTGGTDAPAADTPAVDGGGADARLDGGVVDGGAIDGGGACPPAVAPYPVGDACARATGTCLETATTVEAQAACFAMDPDPDGCVACLTAESAASCTRMGSCADEYGPLKCCLDVECPSGDPACVSTASMAGGACATEGATFDTCLRADLAIRPPVCGITADLCFL